MPGSEKAFGRVKGSMPGSSFEGCQVVYSRAFCQICLALEAWAQRLGCAPTGSLAQKETGSKPRIKANSVTLLTYHISSILCSPCLYVFSFLIKVDQCIDCFNRVHHVNV